MDTDALTQVQKRLAELPVDIRNAVQAADLNQKVQAIGVRHQLHIDQIGELGDETLLAMLGFSPLDNFSARLSKTLNLGHDAAEKLAADVSQEIFGSIRESMKDFAAQRAAPPAPPKVALATTPSPSVALATGGPQKPPLSPDLHKADIMLAEKTVSLPPQGAPAAEKPIYKADPYRESV